MRSGGDVIPNWYPSLSHGPLGPEDRLDIYAQMYCARLLDALAEDFPRVAAVLGEARFRALGREYLRHSPSSHPSLRHLGARFPEFLLSQTETPVPQFAGDLARLEWARVTVFDAPDVEVLRLDDLQAIPADAWATIRFQVIPALAVLTCAWPVQQVWQNEDFTRSDPPPHENTTLRAWRREFTVYHASMDTIECAALAAITRVSIRHRVHGGRTVPWSHGRCRHDRWQYPLAVD